MQKKKIMLVFDARPETIKMASLYYVTCPDIFGRAQLGHSYEVMATAYNPSRECKSFARIVSVLQGV